MIAVAVFLKSGWGNIPHTRVWLGAIHHKTLCIAVDNGQICLPAADNREAVTPENRAACQPPHAGEAARGKYNVCLSIPRPPLDG
jgi:hypothetical protein